MAGKVKKVKMVKVDVTCDCCENCFQIEVREDVKFRPWAHDHDLNSVSDRCPQCVIVRQSYPDLVKWIDAVLLKKEKESLARIQKALGKAIHDM